MAVVTGEGVGIMGFGELVGVGDGMAVGVGRPAIDSVGVATGEATIAVGLAGSDTTDD